jgi:uncharacterized membrane protein YgcG
MKQKNIFIIAAIGLLVAFIIAALLRNVAREEAPSPVAAARTEAKAPPAAAPAPPKPADTGPSMVRAHSPLLGSADAPVVIVEFFDPACETCAAFYPIVKQIRAGNPDSIAVVLRYAPFHKGSAKVVAALEAARKQDKYWPALEALLKTQSDWAANHEAHLDRIWPHLKKAGLDVAQPASRHGRPGHRPRDQPGPERRAGLPRRQDAGVLRQWQATAALRPGTAEGAGRQRTGGEEGGGRGGGEGGGEGGSGGRSGGEGCGSACPCAARGSGGCARLAGPGPGSGRQAGDALSRT